MFGLIRKLRRKSVASKPFPEGWRDAIEGGWPLFGKLPRGLQEALERKVLVFVDEKRFEGLDGFEITDDVRVLIAAQACLLLLGNGQQHYDRLRSVLVYPEHYGSKSVRVDASGVVEERDQEVLGESWQHGTVTLSWAAVKRGAANPDDGKNVVIHEFAHQLDQRSGRADGAPLLRSGRRYAAWSRVFSEEYEDLQGDISRGRRTVMDGYGASSPAEFFAVATECFFEKPEQLRRRRPGLYEQLAIFYGQDPSAYR